MKERKPKFERSYCFPVLSDYYSRAQIYQKTAIFASKTAKYSILFLKMAYFVSIYHTGSNLVMQADFEEEPSAVIGQTTMLSAGKKIFLREEGVFGFYLYLCPVIRNQKV